MIFIRRLVVKELHIIARYALLIFLEIRFRNKIY